MQVTTTLQEFLKRFMDAGGEVSRLSYRPKGWDDKHTRSIVSVSNSGREVEVSRVNGKKFRVNHEFLGSIREISLSPFQIDTHFGRLGRSARRSPRHPTLLIV